MGIGTEKTLGDLFINFDNFFSKSGVDISSPSEANKVFFETLGLSIHLMIKSTKFSRLIKDFKLSI
jgi:hypothetical protein